MRRADRLFRIVQHLRGGRLLTARRLAELCEVSERTVYRDVADLMASGVPIEGAAGVGYVLRSGYEMPPLMLTRDEAVALVAGARMIAAFGGATLAAAAGEAVVKIDAILPEAERARARETHVRAFGGGVVSVAQRALIDAIDGAVTGQRRLDLDYRDEAGGATRRTVRPFGLWFWGKVWTLVAWCEVRSDWRMFRVDRIEAMAEGEPFRMERGRDRAAFLAAMAERSRHEGRDPAASGGPVVAQDGVGRGDPVP